MRFSSSPSSHSADISQIPWKSMQTDTLLELHFTWLRLQFPPFGFSAKQFTIRRLSIDTCPRDRPPSPFGTTSKTIRKSLETRSMRKRLSSQRRWSLPAISEITQEDSWVFTGSITIRMLPRVMELWWMNISKKQFSRVVLNTGDRMILWVVSGVRRRWRKWPENRKITYLLKIAKAKEVFKAFRVIF